MNPALLASQLTVTGLFDRVADACRGRIALREGGRTRLYADMADRVRRTAEVLHHLDSEGTGRFAILSENRGEYLEAQLAVARLGQVIACMNWRLAPVEIQHCLDLVDPAVLLVSPRHAPLLNTVRTTARVIQLDAGWEVLLRQAQSPPHPSRAAAEDPWLILYTGGTTGLPKGAVISQRAVLARMHAMEHDLTLRPGDPCLAWPPMFHMGGTEPAMHALLTGGEVFHRGRLRPGATRRASDAA